MQDPRKLTAPEYEEEEEEKEYVYKENEYDKFLTNRIHQCVKKVDAIEEEADNYFTEEFKDWLIKYLIKDTKYAVNYGMEDTELY